MKKQIITMALLLFAVGMAQAQDNEAKIEGNPNVNTIVVNTTGDVTIYQGDKFEVKWGDDRVRCNMNFEMKDSVAYLSGIEDFEVTIPSLKYLKVNSCGDVVARDALAGKNLSIYSSGVGDIDLNLSYSNIYLKTTGTGDVTLRGDATALMVESSGVGDFNAANLKHSVSFVNVTGVGKGNVGKVRKMVFVHYSNKDAGQISDNCRFAASLGSPILFEQDHSDWLIKGYEHINNNDDVTAVMNAAAPFFNQEQHRNRSISESEDLTNVIENDTLKQMREQLDEDLGNLVKDITQGIVKGSRENWDEDQWDAWGDSIELRTKEYDRNAKKYGKEMGRRAREIERNANASVQHDECKTEKRSLFYSSHWEGFEAGLNMLLDPQTMNTFSGTDGLYSIKPFSSWYIGLNSVEVGIAFDRNYNAGIFTGIGFGFNNFRWQNAVRTENVDGHAQNVGLDPAYPVKKSKLGIMYAQAPLMIEISPRHSSFYLDLGVTGGIRLVSWTKVKWQDGLKEKFYDDFGINLFKLDASLRMGGDDFGFFANYSLLPITKEGDLADIHPISIGFSINF